MKKLLTETAERAARYLNDIQERSVAPSPEAVAQLDVLDHPMPDAPIDPLEVLRLLDEIGAPATIGNAGARYFGFVNGGSLPATVAAGMLAVAWDQNAGLRIISPVASRLEEIALGWIKEVLGLPAEVAGGFVTGATMANFTALASARHHLLARKGWDVEEQGLFGAPEIRVVVGEEVHTSIRKALSLVGFGRERVIPVPVDAQGRMRADQLPELDDMTIVCVQAGNVNTGAFDPIAEVCKKANAAGAWVHVDGAFGLWAAASPKLHHLTEGIELADSWGADAHKWLNVPYDSGIALCRHPQSMRAAMTVVKASYLIQSDEREPYQYTPEMSRRARGIEVWAALRSLGKQGLAEMIERTCRHAKRFAEGLTAMGFDVLNEVVINQVMVSFGSPELTQAIIKGIQEEGTLWASGTTWQGHTAMRISVSSWATTEEDVERSLAAIQRVAEQITAQVR